MRRIILSTAVALTATGILPVASAQSNTFTVDCNRGQKIARVLDQGDFRRPLVVNIRGTCNESVAITRDWVTLQGDTKVGATVNAPGANATAISIAAKGITITRLTVTGGSNGIRALRQSDAGISDATIRDSASHGIRAVNAALRIRDTTIEHSGESGLSVEMGGSVNVFGGQIHDNTDAGIYAQSNSTVGVSNATISGNGGDGIFLTDGSYGTVNNSAIAQNGGHGVFVLAGSHGSLNGNTISANGTDPTAGGCGVLVNMSTASIYNGNVITDNRQTGIHADFSNLQIGPSTISNNHESGVDAYFGTAIVLSGATVHDNDWYGFYVSTNSTAQLDESTFKGNGSSGIRLENASKLQLYGPVMDVTGNGGWGLDCGDAESSVNDTGLLDGSVSPACTGYD